MVSSGPELCYRYGAMSAAFSPRIKDSTTDVRTRDILIAFSTISHEAAGSGGHKLRSTTLVGIWSDTGMTVL